MGIGPHHFQNEDILMLTVRHMVMDLVRFELDRKLRVAISA